MHPQVEYRRGQPHAGRIPDHDGTVTGSEPRAGKPSGDPSSTRDELVPIWCARPERRAPARGPASSLWTGMTTEVVTGSVTRRTPGAAGAARAEPVEPRGPYARLVRRDGFQLGMEGVHLCFEVVPQLRDLTIPVGELPLRLVRLLLDPVGERQPLLDDSAREGLVGGLRDSSSGVDTSRS